MSGIRNQIHIKHFFANTNAEMQAMVTQVTDQNKAPIIYNREARAFFEFIVAGGSIVANGETIFTTGDGGNTRRVIFDQYPVQETNCLITNGPNVTATAVATAGGKLNFFETTNDLRAPIINSTTNNLQRYNKSNLSLNTTYALDTLTGVLVNTRLCIQVANRIFVGNGTLGAVERRLIAFDTTAFTAVAYALSISGSPTAYIVPLDSDATWIYFYARTVSGLHRFGRFNHTTNTFDGTFLNSPTTNVFEAGSIDGGFLFALATSGRVEKINIGTWALGINADLGVLAGGSAPWACATANGLFITLQGSTSDIRTLDQATLTVENLYNTSAAGSQSLAKNGNDIYYYGTTIDVFNSLTLAVNSYSYPHVKNSTSDFAFSGSNFWGADSGTIFAGSLVPSSAPDISGITLPPVGRRKIIKGCNQTYLLDSTGALELFVNSNTITTIGTSTAYTGNISGFVGYTDNTEIVIEPHLTSGLNPTININSLGARSLRNQDGSALLTGFLLAGRKYRFIYNDNTNTFELSYQAQAPAATQPQDVLLANLVSNTNIAGTYNNGTGGVGATMTGLANGQITVDGVIPVPGDVVLLTGQTAQLQNGPYVVLVNTPISPYSIERIPEADETAEVDSLYMYISDGVALSGTSRIQTTPDPAIGTNPIVFEQTSATTTPTAPIRIPVTGTTATLNRGVTDTYILDLTASTGNVTLTLQNPVNGNAYDILVKDHVTTPRTLTFPVGTQGIEQEQNTIVADLPNTDYILTLKYIDIVGRGTNYTIYGIAPNVRNP